MAELVAAQPQVEAIIDRAYELNPDYEHGAIDQFLISYEFARQGAKGDFATRCKAHFDRAVYLSNGQLASPYVAYAETVSLQKQNRREFEGLLKQALAVDPDSRAEWRLSNLVMQRRARWLLSREDELLAQGGSKYLFMQLNLRSAAGFPMRVAPVGVPQQDFTQVRIQSAPRNASRLVRGWC